MPEKVKKKKVVKGKTEATKSDTPVKAKVKKAVHRPEVLSTLARESVTVYVNGPYATRVYWRPAEGMKDVIEYLGAKWGTPLQGKQGPRKKEGLRTFQVRTLKSLVGNGGDMTLAELAKDVGCGDKVLVVGIGPINPELREGSDSRHGFKCLLSLGYVETVAVPTRTEKTLTAYRVTEAGKDAYKQLTDSGYELRDKHPGPGKSKTV